jgi:LuxR family transcriptional regulator, quorum-sensing system regulator SdiA
MVDVDARIADCAFGDIAEAGFFIAYRVGFLLPEFEHNALPPDWVKRYTRFGLMMQDPVMRWIYSSTGTVRWSEIDFPDSHGVLVLAAEHGLTYGAAISIGDTNGTGQRSFGNFCRSDRELTTEEMQDLEQRLDTLFAGLAAPNHMTDSELEALRLVKNGMLIKEVAYHLGISDGAVKQRLRSAKVKLGARTTAQAVSIASSYGLI